MTFSLLAWTALAVLVFWAVGAYNRLVRLRSDVNAAFAALHEQLQQQAQLAASVGESGDMASGPEEPAFLAQIHGASSQLAACLSAGRTRPLDHDGVAALAAASQVLAAAWERAERDDAHDLAGPQLPDTLVETRAELLRQTQGAVEQFDAAVDRYNHAIAQFPAVLLAFVFGFKAGRRF